MTRVFDPGRHRPCRYRPTGTRELLAGPTGTRTVYEWTWEVGRRPEVDWGGVSRVRSRFVLTPAPVQTEVPGKE